MERWIARGHTERQCSISQDSREHRGRRRVDADGTRFDAISPADLERTISTNSRRRKLTVATADHQIASIERDEQACAVAGGPSPCWQGRVARLSRCVAAGIKQETSETDRNDSRQAYSRSGQSVVATYRRHRCT